MNILKELADVAYALDEQTLATKNDQLRDVLQRQSNRVTNIFIKLAQDNSFLNSGFNEDEPQSDFHEVHEGNPSFDPEAYSQVMGEMNQEEDDQDPVQYLIGVGYSMKDLKQLPYDKVAELAQKEGMGQDTGDDFGFMSS